MMRPFKGKSGMKDGFEKWLKEFNHVADRIDWTDSVRCEELPFKLMDTAQEQYNKTPERITENWDSLVEEMTRLFPTIEESPAAKQAAFRKCVHTDKETVEEFAAKLLELAHDAYIDMESTVRDAEAAAQFRKGIADGRIRLA